MRPSIDPANARGRGLRTAAAVMAAQIALLFVAATPASAGHDVFHIFTPVVEQGTWGVEILSGFQSGFAHAEDHAGEEHGHAEVNAAHEFALHGGLTQFWMMKLALGLEHEADGGYGLTSIAAENVFRLPGATASAFDAGWFTALSAGLTGEQTNAVEFGPVLTASTGKLSLALNPFFEKTFGSNREEGIAFTYGWRATYGLTGKLSIGVEGYGEIENIADAPGAAAQVHRMGPVLYLGHVHGAAPIDLGHTGHGTGHGAGEPGHRGGHGDEAGHDGDWHAEIGLLFGLTPATPGTAIKLNFGYDF